MSDKFTDEHLDNDEFEFDDLDNELDGFGDMPDMDMDGGGEREPARGVDKKYIARNLVSSEMAAQAGRKIASEYSNIGRASTNVIDTATDLDRMRKQVLEDIAPTITATKRAGRILLPKVEHLMPKKASEKLAKILKEEEEFDYSGENARDAAISSAIGEIFQVQAEQQEAFQTQQQVDKIIGDKISEGRHKDQISVLGQIRNLVKSNQLFLQGEYRKYLMKDLELKYRHLFVATDTYEAVKGMGMMLEAKMSDVVKNTGLPDIIKRQKSEEFSALMRERVYGAAQDRLADLTSGFRGKVMDNVKSKVFDKITDSFNEIVGGVAGIVEMQDEMDSAKREMGEEVANIETSFAASMIRKLLVDTGFVSARALVGDQRFKDFDDMLGHMQDNAAIKARGFVENTEGMTFGDFFKSYRPGSKGMSNSGDGEFLHNFLSSIVPTAQREGGTVQNLFQTHATDSVEYDNLSRKAQTEIIPGLLSKILVDTTRISNTVQATAIAHLNKAAYKDLVSKNAGVEEMVYDESTEDFISASGYRESLMTRAFGSEEDKTSRLQDIVNTLYGGFKSTGGSKEEFDKHFPAIIRVITNLTKHSDVVDFKTITAFLEGDEISPSQELYLEYMFKDVPDHLHGEVAAIFKQAVTRTDGKGEDHNIAGQLTKALLIEAKTKSEGVAMLAESANAFGNKRYHGDILNTGSTSDINKITTDIKRKYYNKYGKDKVEKSRELKAQMEEEIRQAKKVRGLNHETIRSYMGDVNLGAFDYDSGSKSYIEDFEKTAALREEAYGDDQAGRIKRAFQEEGKRLTKPVRNFYKWAKDRFPGISKEEADEIAAELGVPSHDTAGVGRVTGPGLVVQGAEHEGRIPLKDAAEASYFKSRLKGIGPIDDVIKLFNDIIDKRPDGMGDIVNGEDTKKKMGLFSRMKNSMNEKALLGYLEQMAGKRGDYATIMGAKNLSKRDKIEQARLLMMEDIENLRDDFNEDQKQKRENMAMEFEAHSNVLEPWVVQLMANVRGKISPEEMAKVEKKALKDIRKLTKRGYPDKELAERLTARVNDWLGSHAAKLPSGWQYRLNQAEGIVARRYVDDSFLGDLKGLGSTWMNSMKGMLTGKAEGFEARKGLMGLWDRASFYTKSMAGGVADLAGRHLPGMEGFGDRFKGIKGTLLGKMPASTYKTILEAKNMSNVDKLKMVKELAGEDLSDKVNRDAIDGAVKKITESETAGKVRGAVDKVRGKLRLPDSAYRTVIEAKNLSKSDKVKMLYEMAGDDLQDSAAAATFSGYMAKVVATKDNVVSAAKDFTQRGEQRHGDGISGDASELATILTAIRDIGADNLDMVSEYFERKEAVDQEILAAIRAGAAVGAAESPETQSFLKKAWGKSKWPFRKLHQFGKWSKGRGLAALGWARTTASNAAKMFGSMGGALWSGLQKIVPSKETITRGMQAIGGIVATGAGFAKDTVVNLVKGLGYLGGKGVDGGKWLLGKLFGKDAWARKGLGMVGSGLGTMLGKGAEMSGRFGKWALDKMGSVGSSVGGFLGRGLDLLPSGGFFSRFGKKGKYGANISEYQGQVLEKLDQLIKNTSGEQQDREGGFKDYFRDKKARLGKKFANKGSWGGSPKLAQMMMGGKGKLAAGALAAFGLGGLVGGDDEDDEGGITDMAVDAAGTGASMYAMGKVKDKIFSGNKTGPDSPKAKSSKLLRAIIKIRNKLPQRFQKSLSNEVIKKVLGKFSGKLLTRLAAKLLGPVGIIFAVGTAAAAAAAAFSNPAPIIGRGDVGMGDRAKVGAAAALNDILLGIPGVDWIAKLMGVKPSGQAESSVVEGGTSTAVGTGAASASVAGSFGSGSSMPADDYADTYQPLVPKKPRIKGAGGEFTGDFHEVTKAWIKGQEGLSLEPYFDSLGKGTVGYGHLNTEGYGKLTRQQAEDLFDYDYAKHYNEALSIPGARQMKPGQLSALVNMVFNMGKGGVMKFKRALAALRAGKSDEAAREIMSSSYAQQVGGRAAEVSKVIASGNLNDIKPKAPALHKGGKIVGTADDYGDSRLSASTREKIDQNLAAAAKSSPAVVAASAAKSTVADADPQKPKISGANSSVAQRISSGQAESMAYAETNKKKLDLMSEQRDLMRQILEKLDEKQQEPIPVVVTVDEKSTVQPDDPKHPSSIRGRASRKVDVKVGGIGSGVDFRRQAVG